MEGIHIAGVHEPRPKQKKKTAPRVAVEVGARVLVHDPKSAHTGYKGTVTKFNATTGSVHVKFEGMETAGNNKPRVLSASAVRVLGAEDERAEEGAPPQSAIAAADLEALRKKLQSLSYSTDGQDPRALFKQFDRDNSGALDFTEFTTAVRKGGRISAGVIADTDLQRLFAFIDADGSGDMSIEELTAFVWDGQAPQRRTKVKRQKAPAKAALTVPATRKKTPVEDHFNDNDDLRCSRAASTRSQILPVPQTRPSAFTIQLPNLAAKCFTGICIFHHAQPRNFVTASVHTLPLPAQQFGYT